MHALAMIQHTRCMRRAFWLVVTLLVALVGVPGLGSNRAYALPRDPGDTDPIGTPPPFHAPQNGFNWIMVSRFGRDDNQDGLIDYHFTPGNPDVPGDLGFYNPAYVNPTSLQVKFNGCAAPNDQDPLEAENEYAWTIDGVSSSSTSCLFQRGLAAGHHTVELTVTNLADGHATTYQQSVDPKDILIASLGDSIASGEGNPDIPQRWVEGPGYIQLDRAAHWEDEKCHRSAWSGHALAAMAIERNDPHTSVTFVSFACSGAVIPGTIDQQIPALARTLNGRPIDALIISDGGNDLGFDPLLRACVALDDSCMLHGDAFSENLTKLPDKYNGLNGTISQQLNVANVFFTEYPSPAFDDSGNICQSILGELEPSHSIDAQESAWAESTFRGPINSAILDAVDRARTAHPHIHWDFVDGVANLFAVPGVSGHGYCAGDSWVRHIHESLYLQGPIEGGVGATFGLPDLLGIRLIRAYFFDSQHTTGTMHPNIAGQAAYRDRIVNFLNGVFYPAPPNPPPTFSIAYDVGSTTSRAGANGWLTGSCTAGQCTSDHVVLRVDATDPDGIQGASLWVNGEHNDISGTGCTGHGVSCSINLIDPQHVRWNLDIASEGMYRLAFMAKDGNLQISNFVHDVYVDLNDPTATASISSTAPPTAGWYTTPVSVTLSGSDGLTGSGVETIEYHINNGEVRWVAPADAITIGDDGSHMLTYVAVDRAGRRSQPQTLTVSVDQHAPITTAAVSPQPDSGGWSNSDVTIKLSAADDGAPVRELSYLAADPVQGGSWVTVNGARTQFTVSREGQTDVAYKATDALGHAEEAKTLSIKIDRTPPSATFNAPTAALNEGSSFRLELANASDSGWDLPAAPYAFDCGDGTGYGAFGSSSSTTCLARDNGTPTVKGKLQDRAGHVTEYRASVTIANVAPTATFTAPTTAVNEGAPFALSLDGSSDPSSVDTAVGLQYAFDCGGGYGAFGASKTVSCTPPDNGTPTVKGKVKDKDGGVSEYSTSVTVSNVAPTATFSAPATVNEGSPISLALTAPVDAAGDLPSLQYAFDCGSGYSVLGASNTASCPTSDNGTRTVRAKVQDKDGAFTEYTRIVTIANVAPTATFSAPATVNESSPISLALTAPVDAAGDLSSLQYAFNCGDGAGYSLFGASTTASCATTDNGTRTVKGKVKDKDGGVTEYTRNVVIDNIAPSATFTAPTAAVNEGSSFSLSLLNPSDPSSADRSAGFSYAFDCSDGVGYRTFGSSNSIGCPTTDNGTRTVKGKVKDKDGGVSEYTASVIVANVAPTARFNAPTLVPAGGTFELSLSDVADPSSADRWAGFAYTFNCGTVERAISVGASASCKVAGTDTLHVRGTVGDKDGGFTTYSADVKVVSELAVEIASPAKGAVVSSGTPVDLSASFADPVTEAHSCTIDWGDTAVEAGTVTEGNGSGTCGGSHVFKSDGNYTITVMVADAKGNEASAQVAIAVQT
ncbi:MAG: OmpL47-type beta-barrel domain-containing protein [Roseiflexaceae bacterium]